MVKKTWYDLTVGGAFGNLGVILDSDSEYIKKST